MAAILMAAFGLLAYRLASTLLPERTAIIVALASTLGTQVWSTASRGLWSHTWGLLLLGWVIVRLFSESKGMSPGKAVVLGSATAWLYCIRPTFLVSVVAIAVYCAFRWRRRSFPFIASLSAWLLVFLGLSMALFGAFVPPRIIGARR